MPAARSVGVSELIDQHTLRSARNDGVKVHFLQPLTAILDAAAGNDVKPLQQGFGFFATVSFDDPDDDVVAILAPGPRRLEHRVGFADARRGPNEDTELPSTTFLALGCFEQSLR